MKDFIIKRLALAAQITLVVAQVAGIVYALEARASDSSPELLAQEVIDYRIEIQQRAGGAVIMTQSETIDALETKLNIEESSSARLAGKSTGNSG
ncbi:MAG: hypothetical protein HKN81_01770 [Gammaproteobacteria bacterium]|nr:hypothetical protein [Gammaproteobacteria bacterium]NND35837.1 hypothetical protein [Gammaproteobacteria bacterium]